LPSRFEVCARTFTILLKGSRRARCLLNPRAELRRDVVTGLRRLGVSSYLHVVRV
jgi:hypothetical protein